MSFRIYTDGSCYPNPGPGGWGALIQDASSSPTELFGGDVLTTNNRMEMTAAIRALEHLLEGPHEGKSIVLFTDSQYVKNGITLWLPKWKRRGWRTADGPVKNVDLWQCLDALALRFTIDWRWVRGHNGDLGNEAADALALRGRLSATPGGA